MKKLVLSVVAMGMFSTASFAEQTAGEKAVVIKDKAVNSASKTMRAGKDKACETLNDKGECVDQKVKHEAQNLKDATATKAKEMKNKVD